MSQGDGLQPVPAWASTDQIWNTLWQPSANEEWQPSANEEKPEPYIAMIRAPVLPDSVLFIPDENDENASPSLPRRRSSSSVLSQRSGSKLPGFDPIFVQSTAPPLIIQSEAPCGRARLFNSLGIPLWEGDLEGGQPELTGSDSNVTHRAVDIHTGETAAAAAAAAVSCVLTPPSPLLPLPLADVVESPDFGLIVLALCAPRIMRVPFDSSSDDRPIFVLAMLPLPLLVAQWGLLLSVFYQSIKDCTTLHISYMHSSP